MVLFLSRSLRILEMVVQYSLYREGCPAKGLWCCLAFQRVISPLQDRPFVLWWLATYIYGYEAWLGTVV